MFAIGLGSRLDLRLHHEAICRTHHQPDTSVLWLQLGEIRSVSLPWLTDKLVIN